ncbi:unnamed protein product [Effrenium voratum]|uniref:Uncharacterized protein n=1 Tax=Effrenium voratum TaxID=2562239 RepID=A0AA36HS64_9DINO|nr:unnamed protein product [Effrenium voratum]
MAELNLAKQRTADRVAREKVMATVQTTKRQDSSKETAGSGSVPSIQRQPTNGTLEGGESVMSSHLSLNKDEEEEEEDDLQQVDVSSSSEEEVYKHLGSDVRVRPSQKLANC